MSTLAKTLWIDQVTLPKDPTLYWDVFKEESLIERTMLRTYHISRKRWQHLPVEGNSRLPLAVEMNDQDELLKIFLTFKV